jgi:hypothetical protein
MDSFHNKLEVWLVRPVTALKVAVICATLIGCSEERWSGFYYPDKNDLTTDQYLGTFATLQECRSAALSRMQETNNADADYECGLNCNLNSGKPYICERTEK